VKALRRDTEKDGNRRIYVVLEDGNIKLIEDLHKTITKDWTILENEFAINKIILFEQKAIQIKRESNCSKLKL
jgi:hypothetical protein